MANERPSFERFGIQIEKLNKRNERLRLNRSKCLQIIESSCSQLFENSFDGFALCPTIFQHDIPSDFIYLNVKSAFKRIARPRDMAEAIAIGLFPGFHSKKRKILGKVYGHE